jgi:hypothetical protein
MLVRITVLVVEQRWVGWFLVRHTVRVATLSERRILPDVLNLQLDQRKFIVSEQFIEVGLVTNNDGGGGESIVYAQEEEIHSGHDWLVYLPDLGRGSTI